LPTLPIVRCFNIAKLLLVVSFISVLAACGGGGAKAPSTGTTSGGVGSIPGTDSGTTNTATGVQLLVSSQSLPSSGTEKITLTAVALNANGRALTDKTITLSISDPAPDNRAFITNDTGKSDSTGVLTATLSLGSNKTNRTITLTATSDSATSTNTVDVVGTTLTMSGSTSLVLNQTSTLTISLKDSADKPIQGAQLAVSSRSGNGLTDTAGGNFRTNRNGQVIAQVSATVSGGDLISADGLGTSTSSSLVISGSNFAFTSPSPPADTDAAVNFAQPIKIKWVEGGVAQSGRTVSFSATRGTLSAPSVVTDSLGEGTVTIISSQAGVTTVQASAQGGTPSTTLNFVFVTNSATVITVKADKTTVAANALGTSTSRATITATVRDAADNLVKNAKVQFRIKTDTTGGTLTTTEDITDVAGQATVDYIAGTTTSANEGVEIAAKVIDVNGVTGAVLPVGLENSIKLTVASRALFIRIQTDNKTDGGSAPLYKKAFVALVTDSAGNPVRNAKVQFEVRPAQPPYFAYRKGIWIPRATWVQRALASCYNEDLNLNGVIDPIVSEDTNYNGILDGLEDRDGNGKLNGVPPLPGVEIGELTAGALVPSEDRNGNNLTDIFSEDINGNGRLDAGEDINGNAQLDISLSEDLNGNGILERAERLHTNGRADTDEDFNQSGTLTPGNVVGVTTDVVADELGFAKAIVSYAQNFAYWVQVTLTAKVTVEGSETTSSLTFIPPGVAGDFSDITAAPPGQISPFGVRQNCKSRD
jgi:hypothetical protein